MSLAAGGNFTNENGQEIKSSVQSLFSLQAAFRMA
jgi:hypothetical protein